MDVTVVAMDSGPVYAVYSPYATPLNSIAGYDPGMRLAIDILGRVKRLPRDAVDALGILARLLKHAVHFGLDPEHVISASVESGFLIEAGAPFVRSVERINGVLRVAIVCRNAREAAPIYMDLPPLDARFSAGVPFADFVRMYAEAAKRGDGDGLLESVVAEMLTSLVSRGMRCYTGVMMLDVVNATSFCDTVRALKGRLMVRDGCTLYRNLFNETRRMCMKRFTVSDTVYTLFYTLLSDDSYDPLFLAGDYTIEHIASLCLAFSM